MRSEKQMTVKGDAKVFGCRDFWQLTTVNIQINASIGIVPIRSKQHFLIAICNCQSLHHAAMRSRASCKQSLSTAVSTSV